MDKRGVSEADLAAAFEDACRFGRTEIAEYLLAKGADVDGQGQVQITLVCTDAAADPSSAGTSMILRQAAPLPQDDRFHQWLLQSRSF